MSLSVDGAHPGAAVSPERDLACAVLETAINDARSCGESAFMKRHIAAARRFLLASNGAWAASRTSWCDRAGIDPEAFDAAIKRMFS